MKNVTNFFFVLILFFNISVMAQTTLTVTTGTPTLDGVVSPGEYTSTPLVTSLGVTLNAMADGEFLYLAAEWDDPTTTENIYKKLWSFDGSTWDQSGDEDRIGFVWDMGLNGSDGANCMTMCHSPLMHTNNGIVDVWHWKAARTNPMGFVDDKYWDIDDRHSDSGTSAYQDNADNGSGFPTFMATNDPGANVDFLTVDANALTAFDPYSVLMPAHTVEVAVAFDQGVTFSTGDVIPGYVLRIPDGDRASVMSAGKYDNGVWTVEFKKPFAGSNHDFEVIPGSSVEFTHEIFDNEGHDHPNNGFDATVYTLDFSLISDVEPINSEIPSDFKLDQNYPNPFNPSTTIKYSISKQSFVTLKVYDVLGNEIKTLVSEEISPGNYEVEFNSNILTSGIYFYKLQAGNFTQTKKMILLK